MCHTGSRLGISEDGSEVSAAAIKIATEVLGSITKRKE
jgi:hypothetical protein